jgi:hypothetical protein
MSLTKSLHPDEKYKADKLGRKLVTTGLGLGGFLLVPTVERGLCEVDFCSIEMAGDNPSM